MRLYIISYDVTDDDRRNEIADFLLGWGRRIQYSVFECPLSDTAHARVRAGLADLVKHDEDQVLLFDLGNLEERAPRAVEAIGRPYTLPDRGAIIV